MVIMQRVTIGSESSLDEKEIDSDNQHNSEESVNDNGENSNEENSYEENNEINENSNNESNNSVDQSKDVKSMNLGWADSVQKILKSSKPKSKKTLVLSRAKKLTDKKKHDSEPVLSFEIEGEIKKEKLELDESLSVRKDPDEPLKKKAKNIWIERVKPNILDKDRERILSKIATKGVVQLFNAVRAQQKDISKKLDEAGPLERKRDKVLKSIDKRSFLDVLMGDKSIEVDNPVKKNEDSKNEPMKLKSDEDEVERSKSPTWNILRDDFMMGGKLKDWDKKVSDEEMSTSQEIESSNSE